MRRQRGRLRGSYALIPNNGCLDTRYSITIIAWIYPEKPGPIVHYNPKGWGLHLWLTHPNELYLRLMPRKGSRHNVKPLTTQSLKPYSWNYISATYDHRTGLLTLWLNGLPVSQRNIGKFPLGVATNYPIVIGQRPGDRRIFRGRIACLQIYNVAMTRAQIIARRKQCFRPGRRRNYSLIAFKSAMINIYHVTFCTRVFELSCEVTSKMIIYDRGILLNLSIWKRFPRRRFVVAISHIARGVLVDIDV